MKLKGQATDKYVSINLFSISGHSLGVRPSYECLHSDRGGSRLSLRAIRLDIAHVFGVSILVHAPITHGFCLQYLIVPGPCHHR
jgi:hypothetical protein